jgi:hypothetical protein
VGDVSAVDLGQGHDGEDGQDDQLGPEQRHLSVGRKLDADVADGRHHHDPDDPHEGHPERAVGQAVGPEEGERVGPGDLAETRHHDQIGDEDAPSREPAGLGAHGPGHPSEGGAAVGIGSVHVVVGRGDEQHGDERQQHYGRRIEAHTQGHDAQGRRQAVSGGRRGHADHQAREHAEGAGLQPLAADLRCPAKVRRSAGTRHGSPPAFFGGHPRRVPRH